jgi:hypothetical protein
MTCVYVQMRTNYFSLALWKAHEFWQANIPNPCYLEFNHHQVVLIYTHIAVMGWICRSGVSRTKDHGTLMQNVN